MSKGGKLTYAIHNINVHILNQASNKKGEGSWNVVIIVAVL